MISFSQIGGGGTWSGCNDVWHPCDLTVIVQAGQSGISYRASSLTVLALVEEFLTEC